LLALSFRPSLLMMVRASRVVGILAIVVGGDASGRLMVVRMPQRADDAIHRLQGDGEECDDRLIATKHSGPLDDIPT
jgi:hypothetical protein